MTFIITSLIVIGIIIRFMIVQKNEMDHKTICALSLIIAGGLGNLIDRIIRGYVVDFIDITPIISFPKFNIADIYIFIGCVLLAIFFGRIMYHKAKIKKENKE